MEGVILYVVLVKVFVKSTHKKYYILAFTMISYGRCSNSHYSLNVVSMTVSGPAARVHIPAYLMQPLPSFLGAPLLYMGAIAIPIGFRDLAQIDYGYDLA